MSIIADWDQTDWDQPTTSEPTTFESDSYAAPYPPRRSYPGVLTWSLIAAVVTVNLCAGGVGMRLATLSSLDVGSTSAVIASQLPPPQPFTRLAVLDASPEPQAPPLQRAVLIAQARQMSAQLNGSEATGIIDAIDHDNDVTASDNPAPACISCDTLPSNEQVDIVAGQ